MQPEQLQQFRERLRALQEELRTIQDSAKAGAQPVELDAMQIFSHVADCCRRHFMHRSPCRPGACDGVIDFSHQRSAGGEAMSSCKRFSTERGNRLHTDASRLEFMGFHTILIEASYRPNRLHLTYWHR